MTSTTNGTETTLSFENSAQAWKAIHSMDRAGYRAGYPSLNMKNGERIEVRVASVDPAVVLLAGYAVRS
jgi:hypothetical protein